MPGVVKTGTPGLGKETYFGLGSASAPTVADDISDFLTAVDTAEDTAEVDATTFRNASARILAGVNTIGYTLTGLWSAESHTFLAPLRGMTDVAFEYGPLGLETGMTKISGTCTVVSVSDPASTVDGIPDFTVELKILTRTDGTFPVLLSAPSPEATRAAAAASTGLGLPVKRVTPRRRAA